MNSADSPRLDRTAFSVVSLDEQPERLVKAMQAFGFDLPQVEPELFMQADRVGRMGIPPVRLEIQTSISGAAFSACYERRVVATWDDVSVHIIGLELSASPICKRTSAPADA